MGTGMREKRARERHVEGAPLVGAAPRRRRRSALVWHYFALSRSCLLGEAWPWFGALIIWR